MISKNELSIPIIGFPLTRKTPGNLSTWNTPEIYFRPGIFGTISQFTLVLTL